MRTFFIQLLLYFLPLFTVLAQSTDTLYLGKTMRKVDSKKNAAYIRVISYLDATKTEGTEKSFLVTGEKISECSFIVERTPDFERRNYVGLYTNWYKNGKIERQSNYLAGKLDGKETRWYENGQIHNISNYTEGKKQGLAISYYPDGKVKRQEVFANNVMAAGKCFTKTGADTIYYPLEEMPVYPGGETALNNFIRSNLKYPRKAIKQNIQGLVLIQFVVDKTGSIKDPEIVKKLSPELDAESIRVINKMTEPWQPARQEGKPVSFRFTLPIRFGL